MRKTATWSPSAVVRDAITGWEIDGVGVPVGCVDVVNVGGQVSVATGIMVSGVPVGEDEYVRETVRGLVEKAVSKITQIKHGLQLVSPQSLLTLTQYCLQPLLDFQPLPVHLPNTDHRQAGGVRRRGPECPHECVRPGARDGRDC